ncbi:WD40 repeat-like protein [Jaminaea rosea]|uniref:WD40 repeat-like protein n=1 Tax=Jaminaea rosea TaxID=1569628 RepID=A0A316UKA1_9BASI|nr:WD40 repeat-like protein [Jaminaea rosea]PWN25228.1 WD40 repeat-like protein [Jaminaea rosea]
MPQASSSSSSAPPPKRTKYDELGAIEPFYTGSGSTSLTRSGRYLFTALDNEVLCSDVEDGAGRVIGRLEPDGEEISSISVTPNGSHVCITTRAASCTLYIYAINSFAPFTASRTRSQARAHDAPVAISHVDSTGSLLATGSADGIVKMWDIHGGFVTHVLRGHGGIVSAIAFAIVAQRSRLFTSSVDGRIRVWDLNDRPKQGAQKPIATLGGHMSVVRGLSVSVSGKRLISGSRDKTICTWEMNARGAWALKETIAASEGVEACGFVGEDEEDVFYTGGTSSQVRLWSFRSGSVVRQQPAAPALSGAGHDDEGEGELQGVVGVHQSETALVSLHADSRMIWRSPIDLARQRQLVGFNDEAVDSALLGNHLAVATNSSAIRIYPLPALGGSEQQPGSVSLLPSEPSQPGHTENVLSIDASASGNLLVSGSKDRTARIWAPRDGEWRCIAVAEGHAECVGAVGFSRKVWPDEELPRFLVTASQDRTVKVWDLSPLANATSSPLRLRSLVTLRVHDKAINSLEVAPNDSLLVTGSQDRTAKVFKLAYSPPSKANSQTASAKLSPLATLKGHKRGVWSVAFSPVDPAILTTSGDRTAKLWSLRDFACVKTFEGHSHSVLKGRFLQGSKGTQIVTAGADGLVKLWNVRDEECTTTMEASEDRIWSVSSFGSGEGLAVAGADGHLRYYNDVTEQAQLEELKEREKGVEREQHYENLLAVHDYRGAILICLAEGQPKRLLNLFTKVAASKRARDVTTSLMDLALADDNAAAPEDITGVDEALATLPASHLGQLLKYIRAWNASSRTAGVAQGILHCLLRSYSADELLDAGGDEALDALIAYSERHYARAERMLIESAVLDYVVNLMGGSGEEGEAVTNGNGAHASEDGEGMDEDDESSDGEASELDSMDED